MWTLLCLLLSFDMATATEWCNTTVVQHTLDRGGKKVSLTVDATSPSTLGKPYYCWVNLQAGADQYVAVDVTGLNAGEYDVTGHSCVSGFLRVSESIHGGGTADWMPPTTLCGNYDNIRVKRYTVTSAAFVEFKVEKAEPDNGFEVDVMFLDKVGDERYPYGHIQRRDGRINNTNCDWLVPAETCFGGCQLISPGFPGVYPPNTSCRYSLINFEDSRVNVRFGGTHGKFDLKESKDCEEDYIVVYDGATESSPLIGRYCGHDMEDIISSGTTLLVEFHSANGGPPWDYSGFQIDVLDRWKNIHEGGAKVEGSLCDWTFTSEMALEGVPHTPDHMVNPQTTCLYTFVSRPGETTKLIIKVYDLKPGCAEYLEIYNGNRKLSRICAEQLKKRPKATRFEYEVKNTCAVVKYHSDVKRISNPLPAMITYEFFNQSQGGNDRSRSESGNSQPSQNTPNRVQSRVNGTECDWLIRVDECVGLCRMVSPNFLEFQDISPTVCGYRLKNFQAERVQIQFRGRFDQYKVRNRCDDALMKVYDGENATSPLIGKYCRAEGEFIVSSGPALYIEFHAPTSGHNATYEQFNIEFTDRWEYAHLYGQQVKDSTCSWSFTSDNSSGGYFNTPDHMIQPQTTCMYHFTGASNQIVEVKLRTHTLRENCEEYLAVYDDETLVDRICEKRLKGAAHWTDFYYNSTGNVMNVKYHSNVRRVSNSQPNWIYYTFFEKQALADALGTGNTLCIMMETTLVSAVAAKFVASLTTGMIAL